jgi:uncharacterized membrane protein
MEAFSDGVIAILITVMVLELRIPHGKTWPAAIIRAQGDASKLALAIGRDLKGKVSPLLYALGIGLAFVNRWLSVAIYIAVALMWLIPDRRVERTFTAASRSPDAPPEP